jgi:protein-L-isoaspartate(D-aspartate) O-methyltransferase
MMKCALVVTATMLVTVVSGCSGVDGGNVSHDEMRKFQAQREKMVETQIMDRGVENVSVLRAMLKVPRHLFISSILKWQAYDDSPLPIGNDQTISQPYIVAFMTEQLDPGPGDRVLEIGTGSGYQAAVLAEIVKEVYTIEIVEPLGKGAAELLKKLGYENIHVRIGDGYQGWPEAAPFDTIIVTCAPDHIPLPLVEQLKVGGRMIIPVGEEYGVQELVLVRKTGLGLKQEAVLPVRFVPMTGKGVKVPEESAPENNKSSKQEEDVLEEEYAGLRNRMVKEQLIDRGIKNEQVLASMGKVPRHHFVTGVLRKKAYQDCSLPTEEEQTISTPYIVASMSEKLQVGTGDRILEVGTGSGYQAAVLAEFVDEVYSIEIVEPLGRQAEAVLKNLGYTNVHVRIGDGYQGWPEAAPFDAILVTCAPDHIPDQLVKQLKFGGKLLIPVANKDGGQDLVFVRKTAGGMIKEAVLPVHFDPMTGDGVKEGSKQ